jgi:hypothetical protein
MHPYLSETLAKMLISDRHREAALYRLAHQMSRDGRKRAKQVASRATKHSVSHTGGEQPCVES